MSYLSGSGLKKALDGKQLSEPVKQAIARQGGLKSVANIEAKQRLVDLVKGKTLLSVKNLVLIKKLGLKGGLESQRNKLLGLLAPKKGLTPVDLQLKKLRMKEMNLYDRIREDENSGYWTGKAKQTNTGFAGKKQSHGLASAPQNVVGVAGGIGTLNQPGGNAGGRPFPPV